MPAGRDKQSQGTDQGGSEEVTGAFIDEQLKLCPEEVNRLTYHVFGRSGSRGEVGHGEGKVPHTGYSNVCVRTHQGKYVSIRVGIEEKAWQIEAQVEKATGLQRDLQVIIVEGRQKKKTGYHWRPGH